MLRKGRYLCLRDHLNNIIFFFLLLLILLQRGKKSKFVGHLQTETSAINITRIAEPGEAVLRNSLQKKANKRSPNLSKSQSCRDRIVIAASIRLSGSSQHSDGGLMQSRMAGNAEQVSPGHE